MCIWYCHGPTLDGVTNVERAAEAAGGAAAHLSNEEIENGSPFRSGQKFVGQETETVEVRY